MKAFTAAVLGGIGNLRGALLGGLLLGLIENYGAGLFGGQWKDVVAFAVLVLVLMVRPDRHPRRELGEGARMSSSSWTPCMRSTSGGWRGSGGIGARWRALPKGARTAVFLVFLVFLFLLPVLEPPILTTPGADFDSILFYPVAITVLVAIGLNVVVGQAGLLDLGYVAFFAVGAYTVGVLGSEHGDVPWLICVPDRRGRRHDLGLLARARRRCGCGATTWPSSRWASARSCGSSPRTPYGSAGPTASPTCPRPPDIGPLEFNVLDSTPYYWLALVVIIFVVFLMRRLERSRVGRAWTAIREDEDAAELMGVPTFKYKLWAFAIGAAVGGLSGTLYAGYVPAVTPDTFQLILSILFLAAVVLGGAGNLPGVILGGVIVAYLPERLRGARSSASSSGRSGGCSSSASPSS